MPGFPVLVDDPDKLPRSTRTDHLTFSNAGQAQPGHREDQGKLVDTPAVAYVNGAGGPR